jgi:hypothetical protein
MQQALFLAEILAPTLLGGQLSQVQQLPLPAVVVRIHAHVHERASAQAQSSS